MTVATGGVTGSEILAYAIQTFSGLPYTWGNNDCSGIVQKTYAHFGISLPRVSSQQWSMGTPINDVNALQPGDLVFFNPGTSGAPAGLPGHVGFYAGNGMVFSAYNPSRGILSMPLSQVGQYMGARRIVGSAGNATGVAAGLITGAAGAPATPISSTDTSAQTAATGQGSTCAFALGTKFKVLIFTQNFSICIISKHEARAIIGGAVIAVGGVTTLVGAAVVMQYALDKSGLVNAIQGLPGGRALMGATKRTGRKLPGGTGGGGERRSGGKPSQGGKAGGSKGGAAPERPKREKPPSQIRREKREAAARGEYVEVT